MSRLKYSRKYSIETEEKAVRDGLYKLYSISIKPCEYFGFTVFSLKKNAELSFNPKSLPFILLILRHMSVILDIIIFRSSVHIFDVIYPKQTETEKVAKRILAVTTILGDIIYTMFLFINRFSIIHFHKEQVNFIIEALSPLTQQDKQKVLGTIPVALKILRRYKWIIFGAFYYGVISSVGMFIHAVLKSGKPLDEIGMGIYALPIFYITWTATSYLRLLQRLVMTTLFHGFRANAVIINVQLRELVHSGSVEELEFKYEFEFFDQNTRVEKILDFIKKLEKVINGANLVFGWCIPLDILVMLVTITISLFSVLTFLFQSEFSGALTFGLPLVLNLVILIEFCNAAFGFEKEVGLKSI